MDLGLRTRPLPLSVVFLFHCLYESSRGWSAYVHTGESQEVMTWGRFPPTTTDACMCVYTCVCLCTCIHEYTRVCECVYVHTCTCTY